MSLSAKPVRLSTAAADFEAQFAAKLHWSAETDGAIEQRVADILADVQRRGDAAVLEYTARFDGLAQDSVEALELTQAEFKAAFEGLPAAQRNGAGSGRAPGAHLPRGAEKGLRAKAGATATKTAPCWARRSRRWTAWAFMCPAARRPIRPAC